MIAEAKTLIDLVSIFSPSGEEAAAVQYLVGRMEELGYTRTFIDEAGNAVGIMGEGERQVILLGHIDTVPGELPVYVEGGVLYGRGTVDAKGPLAAFVDAAAEVGPLAGWQIIVIGAVGEEQDSEGARFIAEQYSPDFCIVGEPSRWNRITLGYKGSAWVELGIRQALMHTASKEKSAAEKVVECWQEIQQWLEEVNEGHDKIFDQLTISLQGLCSDSDGIEEWAGLKLNLRLPTWITPEECYTHLENLLPNTMIALTGFPVPAYRAEKNSALVRAFLESIRTAGGNPGFVVKSGTADMNIVAPIWQCPVVAFGPGDSNLDHTPEEHIFLTEYEQAVQVLEGTLNRLVLSQSEKA